MSELEKLAIRNRGAVKGYTRVQRGKPIPVRPHTRTTAEKEVDEKEQARLTRRQKEVELWRTWKDGGQKAKDLEPLMKSLEPVIQKEIGKYKGRLRLIPDSAIILEFQTQALAALRSYDPTKGAALATWVTSQLRKGKRFITENQNIGRIPENRIYEIRRFQDAERDLEEKLGRPVSDEELSGYLGWKINEVIRMASELRSDLRTHSFEEDPMGDVASQEREVLRMIRPNLTTDEKRVYDLIVNKSIMSTADIAKKTEFPTYKVSRIKKSIAAKINKHL